MMCKDDVREMRAPALVEKVDRSNIEPPLYCVLRYFALLSFLMEQMSMLLKSDDVSELKLTSRNVDAALNEIKECARCFMRRYGQNRVVMLSMMEAFKRLNMDMDRFAVYLSATIRLDLNPDKLAEASNKLRDFVEEALALAKTRRMK